MKNKLSTIGLILLVDFVLVVIVIILLVTKTTDLFGDSNSQPDPVQPDPIEEPSEDNNPEELPEHVAITLYGVLLEDNGENGRPLGCGDSLYPLFEYDSEQYRYLENGSTPTGAIVEAVRELINTKNEYLTNLVDEENAYTAAYQENLSIDRVEIMSGEAKVYLTGSVSLGGVCDTPRFKEQMEQTVIAFDDIQSVRFFLNESKQDWDRLFTEQG